MNDVLAAMSSAPDDPMIAYLDVEKGEVVHHLSLQAALEYGEVLEEDDAIRAAIEAEPERFVAIERLGSKRHYQLMARWASTVGEEDLRARLDIALAGKGAFRRFREVVSAYPDLEASWRASEQEALLDIASAGCVTISASSRSTRSAPSSRLPHRTALSRRRSRRPSASSTSSSSARPTGRRS